MSSLLVRLSVSTSHLSGALTVSPSWRSLAPADRRHLLMSFPVYLHLASFRLHPHLVFETLAYFAAFRVYLWLRKRGGDSIDDANRWWVIAAAAVGAVLGSKLLYWFEDPRLTLANWNNPSFLM